MIEKSNLVLLEPFLPLTTSGAVKPGLIAVFLGEELLAAAFTNQMLYRIDLYPVEKSSALREALRKPTSILRERQYSKAGATGQRDFEAENVLKGQA